jgi:NADH:ubiquinone oxidoreductase subunit 3 (subunit A)
MSIAIFIAVVVLIVCALFCWSMCVDSARRERAQRRQP